MKEKRFASDLAAVLRLLPPVVRCSIMPPPHSPAQPRKRPREGKQLHRKAA